MIGDEPPAEVTAGTKAKFKTAVDALALNLSQMKELAAIDIVHTHTWYVSMAGFLAKKLYRIPFVLTTHSLEPLRAWKAEQLGSGYAMSSWMERTAILDADAIIAVSHGTKADILRAYPEVDAAKVHVIYNGIDLREYQKTSATDALVKYGVDVDRAVRFVCRPDHAAEGRRAPGGCGEVSAEGNAGGAVRGCAGYAGDCGGDARGRGGGAGGGRQHRVDRKDGDQAGGDRAVLELPRVLLPVGV